MSKLGLMRFIALPPVVPLEIFKLTETRAGRLMTGEERRVLADMFSTTVGAYDMWASSPNAVEVRKWLKFMVSRSALPANATSPEDQFTLRLQHARERGLPTSAVFTTPMAGEVELLKAVDMVEEHLRKRGIDACQAAPASIREAAECCIDAVNKRIRRGREARTDDYALIWAWADLAEHLGMHPGASYKPAKRKHHSPFLSWLTDISTHMPQRTQLIFSRNLGDRAEHALQMRREHEIDSGLFAKS